jgi:hypothetical protein
MPSLPLFFINDIALFLALLIRVGSSVLSLPLFFGSANIIPLLSYPSLLTALIVVYLLTAYLPTPLLHLLPHPFSTLGILPKADQGGRETHGPDFWFTRDWSATLPLAIGLNKFLVTTFSSVFPFI